MNNKLPDYNSPSELKAFLDLNEMAMQKKFGQNFLINASARTKLIDALDINEKSKVWEIGPGLGAMTYEILKRGASLTVFEIDKGFVVLLKEIFSDFYNDGKLKIIEGDVLKTWKKEFELNGYPDRFFGNLPYNAASAIIADMIEHNVRFEKAVVTVQKEVATRMCADISCQDYSSFSILCQWAYKVNPIMDLMGGCFWPKPHVDSRAVLMSKKDDFPNCENPGNFIKMQRALFSSRRKTVKNNLTQFLSNSNYAELCLKKAGIDPMQRAENISLKNLLLLSDIINEYIIKK